jgi:hypothetical protein
MSVAILGTGVLLAGCGSDGSTGTLSEKPATTAAPPPSPEPAAALEGTWQAGPISPRDAEATLRRYGLEKWIKPFRRLMVIDDDTTLILDIKDEEWDLYGEPRGQPREEIDYDAGYFVRGSEVDKVHVTGATTFRWSVNGDTLKFQWLRSTEPPSEGIPDEVFQRALYMTREFERKD